MDVLSTQLTTIPLAVALASCAGLRAWLPLLLTGSLARLGLLELNPNFGFISSNRALIVFGIAALLEIAADKVPALDHALDVVGTFVRPAAGSLLAASVLFRVKDPLLALALGTSLGAPSALIPHATKASVRAASTAFSAGFANPLLSLLEDIVAVVAYVLAVLVPLLVVAAVVLLALLLARHLSRRGHSTAGA